MDPRIGMLMKDGKKVYYAYVNGFDQPETQGSLEEVEMALGLRASQKASKAKKPATYREYVVAMTQGGEVEETTENAKSAADAISKARHFWNMQDGRTQVVGLLPRRFKARLAK